MGGGSLQFLAGGLGWHARLPWQHCDAAQELKHSNQKGPLHHPSSGEQSHSTLLIQIQIQVSESPRFWWLVPNLSLYRRRGETDKKISYPTFHFPLQHSTFLVPPPLQSSAIIPIILPRIPTHLATLERLRVSQNSKTHQVNLAAPPENPPPWMAGTRPRGRRPSTRSLLMTLR